MATADPARPPVPGVVAAARAAAGDNAVIRVRGLRTSYGANEAVRGIDLTVHASEIFAFVGPSGAGKTTTVEILEGYRDRDAGEGEVLGRDPAHPTLDWRAHRPRPPDVPHAARADRARARRAVRWLRPASARDR